MGLINVHREELFEDVEAVLEVGIFHIESQLDEKMVVLVVGQAEAVSLE